MKENWKVTRPSFTMRINESGNGIELTTPTTDGICKFSDDEVLRLRDALNWALEEISTRQGPSRIETYHREA